MNPGYFQGRYGYVKEWRERHPDYQRQRRRSKRREIQDEMAAESRMKSITFTLPAKALKGEIQDEMRLEIPIIIKSYPRKMEPGGGREIQDELTPLSAGALSP